MIASARMLQNTLLFRELFFSFNFFFGISSDSLCWTWDDLWFCWNSMLKLIFNWFFSLVIRCRDLSRSNGGPVSAYVKVSLTSIFASFYIFYFSIFLIFLPFFIFFIFPIFQFLSNFFHISPPSYHIYSFKNAFENLLTTFPTWTFFPKQVALISDTNANDSGFQRTAVHRNSHRPYFDHRFTFDLCGNEMARIQLAVWHRDREFK